MKNRVIFGLLLCIGNIISVSQQAYSQNDKEFFAKPSHLTELDTIKKVLNYDVIQYYPGSAKPWRKAWEFYQELPQLYTSNGYTNPAHLESLKMMVLGNLSCVLQILPQRGYIFVVESSENRNPFRGDILRFRP